MTFIWKELSIHVIIVDGQSYDVSNSTTKEIKLEKGIHKMDILVSNTSISQLRRRILLNWISNLFGAVAYTIQDAILDSYDNKISFNLTIDDCNFIFLDDYISKNNHTITKTVNFKKLNLVKKLYLFPLVLVGSVLSTIFLILGIISIQYDNIGIGIFSIIISSLSFILTIGLVYKTIKLIKKRTQI